MSRKLMAVVLFVVLGFAKLPVEEHVSNVMKSENLRLSAPDVGTLDQIGQVFFAASLGGLRSLAANIMYLWAYVAFDNADWPEVGADMKIVTMLDPRDEAYWDEAAWQMAYNAATYYQNDAQLRPALRSKFYHDYAERGIAILDEGLQYLPKNHKLYSKLGEIYRDRIGEPRKAAAAFLKSYSYGAKDYYERMAAYEMVKLSDRPSWEQAYQILMKYYNSGKPTASMLRDIPVLEGRLGIPPEKRIKPEIQIPPQLRARIKVPVSGK